jgi:hypothetical protein
MKVRHKTKQKSHRRIKKGKTKVVKVVKENSKMCQMEELKRMRRLKMEGRMVHHRKAKRLKRKQRGNEEIRLSKRFHRKGRRMSASTPLN